MHDELFKRPAVIARYRAGPYAESRERFLKQARAEGYSNSTLERVAWVLLIVAEAVQSYGGSISSTQLRSLLCRRSIEKRGDAQQGSAGHRCCVSGRTSSSPRQRDRLAGGIWSACRARDRRAMNGMPQPQLCGRRQPDAHGSRCPSRRDRGSRPGADQARERSVGRIGAEGVIRHLGHQDGGSRSALRTCLSGFR